MNDYTPDTTWPDPIIVTINDKAYPTQLYNGVQRFMPEPAVAELVKLSIDNCPMIGRPAKNFYAFIPEELKSLSHANPVVNYMVEKNKEEYFGLNDLALVWFEDKFSLEDLIDFETLHGWSVSGFMDSIESKLSNLELGECYEDEDGEVYEDYSNVFTLVNPLWED